MASAAKKKLNAIAAEGIQEFQVTEVPIRLDTRLCAVDPYNRDGTLMSGRKVHELLFKIVKAGFSLLKVFVGIVVDIHPKRLAKVLEHNSAITSGDPLLPDISKQEPPVFTVLHTNHFIMIHRCFHYKTPTIEKVQKLGLCTPDGRLSLSLLKDVDPAFHDYLLAGHRAIRLRADIMDHPPLVRSIISSCNNDLAMGETEMQLMLVLRDMVFSQEGETKTTFDTSELEELEIRFPHLRHHIDPFIKFVAKFGKPNTPFLGNLDVYFSEHVQAEDATSEAPFWNLLSEFPHEYGWAVIAFAKDNYSWDKITGGICKGVPLNKLAKVIKETGKLRELHDFISTWRQAGRFDSISPKGKSRVLALLDIMCSRVTLHQKVRTASPANSKDEVELSKLDHVSTICEYTLMLEKQKATGSQTSEYNPDDYPDLVALLVDAAPTNKSKTKLKQQYMPEYSELGELTNKKALFGARGYRAAHEVMTDDIISYEKDKGQVFQIQNRAPGVIKAVTESSILIEFKNIGPVTWRWSDFPHEHVVVTKGDDVTKKTFVQDSSAYPLTSTKAYKVMSS